MTAQDGGITPLASACGGTRQSRLEPDDLALCLGGVVTSTASVYGGLSRTLARTSNAYLKKSGLNGESHKVRSFL